MSSGVERRSERGEEVMSNVKELTGRVTEKLEQAPEAARREVRRFPLATVGLAVGAGIAIGALGWALLAPRPRTLSERLGARRLRHLLDEL